MGQPDEIQNLLNLMGSLGGYHPSNIYKDKRDKKEKEKALQAQEAGDAQEEEAVSEVRPGGSMGLIWDIEKFIKDVEDLYALVGEKFGVVKQTFERLLILKSGMRIEVRSMRSFKKL